MVSYRKKAHKTQKRRRSKKGVMSKTHKGVKYFHKRGHRQSKRQGKESKSLLARIFGL